MEFTFVSIPEGEEDHYTNNPGFAVKAQLAGRERPYEERQRFPADYDAQIGQRVIARHGLEHLATTDRGVILMRKTLRANIRAVRDGHDPKGLVKTAENPIPTFGNDTVVGLTTGSTPDEDRNLVRSTGVNLAQEFLRTPPLVVSTD